MRLLSVAFVSAAVLAGLAPLAPPITAPPPVAPFPGWPAAYEGRALRALPLTAKEEAFARDFPGRIGRFSDGSRELIVRWVAEPTRRLHEPAGCFRAFGFAVTPMPMRRDGARRAQSCFRAVRGADDLTVCEHIEDKQGNSWPDVSSWYWSAVWRVEAAGWWSFVVADRS